MLSPALEVRKWSSAIKKKRKKEKRVIASFSFGENAKRIFRLRDEVNRALRIISLNPTPILISLGVYTSKPEPSTLQYRIEASRRD